MDNYNKRMQSLFDAFIEASISGDEEGARALSLEISQAQMAHANETGKDPHVRIVELPE